MASVNSSSPLSLFYRYFHYTLSLLVVVLVIVTFGNFQVFISKQTLHQWDGDIPVLVRFLGNCFLLLVFIMQHSVMATEWFKSNLATWLQINVSERLLYVTCTCITLLFLILWWQSIPETYLWYIDTEQRSFLWLFFFLLHLVGWVALGLEVLIMDFREMIGVDQVYRYYNHQNPLLLRRARKLREIYSRMRHPGAVILTTLLWLHPLMTLDRLILACTLTSYTIGHHSFDESHYEFAEKYFTVQFSETVHKSYTRNQHS
ncbi:unnamed protein product [Candidula unifasciata]|uniref:Nuclear envelope membrane protein n=1 Tax=Candidula unifasciata TaxID=100452 RepID=A0A8S3YPE6_9EUPU|nr:unnamed protein product [Candidula unifasciata]